MELPTWSDFVSFWSNFLILVDMYKIFTLVIVILPVFFIAYLTLLVLQKVPHMGKMNDKHFRVAGTATIRWNILKWCHILQAYCLDISYTNEFPMG